MTSDLQNLINNCTTELNDINTKISALSGLDKTAIYLRHYALIKASGTLEYVYRSIVADFVTQSATSQITTYIDSTIRKGSMSVTYDNMCSLLSKFDDTWARNFKRAVNALPNKQRLIDAAKSLVTNRHLFAHGKMTTASFSDIRQYYNDTLILINIFDSIVV